MEQGQGQLLLYDSNPKEQEIEVVEGGSGGGGAFNPSEWGLKARMISRDSTLSRRFSASNISRFREEDKSFRSNFTISSTASSPGYPLGEEIDPSTYSFTTALKGLQARTGRVWQCLSPEGFALNSKWNEAEKYICNPLSGEFPMECLSAKTLSGRCNLTSRITMSAPLTYPSSHHSTRQSQTEPSSQPLTVPGKKPGIVMTRDVGIQSSPMELSSGSMSPTSTLSVAESVQFKKLGTEAMKSNKEVDSKEATGGAAGGDGEVRRLNNDEDKKEKQEKRRTRCRWGHSRSGCLWWMKKMQRDEKNKPSKCNNSVS